MTERSRPLLALLLAALAILGALALPACSSSGGGATAGGPRFHCPMHPTIVSDRPGDCPICGMRLEPIAPAGEQEPATGAQSAPVPGKASYACPMHPEVVADGPSKCPKCGMPLEPVGAPTGEPQAAAGPDDPGSGAAPADRAPIRLTDAKRQLIGVRTQAVERRPMVRIVRAVGRVTFDETRLHHVHTKVSGYVEALHANAVGDRVKAGEPLLEIYSPELVASAEEYLLALKARERLLGATLPSARESGDAIVESARRRLRRFDLGDAQIEALERSGEAPRIVTLPAPISGVVIARNVTQGERIEPGTNLLDIADLSRVWVLAEVYENDLPFVRAGMPGTMTLDYIPGRSWEGVTTLVYPVLSEATRTVRVRLEFANQDLALRPEMYASVSLRADLGVRVLVPEEAVLTTGQRSLVFVEAGEGRYEPREVSLGLRIPGGREVLSGLSEGERVVVSGNFLLDSESRLKAAIRDAAGGAPAPAAPAHEHGGHAP